MKKSWLAYLLLVVLACSTGLLLADKLWIEVKEEQISELSPNWNFSPSTGWSSPYQWLASSFVFVIKRPADVAAWDYGEGEYGLLVVPRAEGAAFCSSFSGLGIDGSDVDLEPLVGKAVLVTSYHQADELAGSIYIERLELDQAVNDSISEYKTVCPFPLRVLSELH